MSAGAAGGAGMGGEGGASEPPMTCSDSDSTMLTFHGPEVLAKGTASGTNGTFEDACDDNGDLIEHVCENQPATGLVAQRSVDCLGMCTGGACEIPCPRTGDDLTVTTADALRHEYELDAGIEGLRYACLREPCAAPAASVGDVLTVMSIAAPDDVRLDCRELFSDTENPLVLSDGCSYIDCSARRPSSP